MVRFLSACLLCVLCGCRSIDVETHADGSWHASYYSYGLVTSLGYLDITVTTNGVANLRMNDLDTDTSTNHVTIVDSSGKVIAEITGSIAEALVK